MPVFDWFAKKKKSLTDMSRSELRRQELLIEKDRTRLLNRVSKLGKEKHELFERGRQEKTPEVRRILAQEFELKTTEQLMLGRQLNIRTKEMLTVSRLRMLREQSDRAGAASTGLGMISQKDMLRLTRMIEDDAVRAEVYQERLDDVLRVGAEVDEGSAGISEAGQTVMDIWDQMDRGAMEDGTEAFDEADRRVREQQQASPEG